ncbi:RuBisCO large subunit C-terminal-like domain-containing protein [Silvanigrella sp.]|jgi:2,3-diketo-5-methylthiopentyl-1-phosphate enolase|uniref:RuBisCO large subunit C-terminal-like domain-containing protein n=1 Tax=Silvanigrella sp. TaxID=2024976 RepID=UPI0037C989BF
MVSFIKNKELLSPLTQEAHAFAKFRINAKKYPASLIEEIAIGQSIGVWEEQHVEPSLLKTKIAKIIACESNENFHEATVAFPVNIWHRKLSWLFAILFGKMSFYDGVQLNSVWFSPDCFDQENLIGPKHSPHSLRSLVGAKKDSPLLMGILKPNVAMSAEKISQLFFEASEAGTHILKDDEIRHDNSPLEAIKRVEIIANESAKRNIKSIYAVHLQIEGTKYIEHAKRLIDAGAQSFLINTWTSGIECLQEIRKVTNIPILSHPSLVGAFGLTEENSTIHPRVTLAQFIRAAGADLSLFPSPYGKLGLEKSIALEIAKCCLIKNENWPIQPMMPVPSAGIKPEHAPLAKKDFGKDFVLNAGTGIFSSPEGIQKSIEKFREELDKI